MPELKEMFEMVTKQTEPDLDSWNRQEERQRRTARNRKIGGLAVAVAVIGALALIVTSTLDGTPTDRTANGGSPSTPPFFPDVVGPQLVRPDGTVVQELPDELASANQLQLSPDGRTIAFYRDGAVWTIGTDGTGARALTGPNHDPGSAKERVDWSPDGEALAYSWNGEIYVMDADGTNKRRLTHSPEGMGSYAPAWSSDGIAIVFWRGTSVFEGDGDAPDDSEIYFVGPGGGEVFRLTHDDHASFQPDPGPGGLIAYRRHDPDDIVVMNGDGTDAHVVTPDPWNPWSPAWSPSGSKLAILRCCSDRRSLSGHALLEVVVIDMTTRETHPLDMWVETENNVPQWITDSLLLVNRQE